MPELIPTLKELRLSSERYERTSTIVTSNLDINEWGEAFPNKLLGAATIDRLRHGAYKAVLDGISFRSPKDNPDNSKIKPLKHSKSSITKGGEKS